MIIKQTINHIIMMNTQSLNLSRIERNYQYIEFYPIKWIVKLVNRTNSLEREVSFAQYWEFFPLLEHMTSYEYFVNI